MIQPNILCSLDNNISNKLRSIFENGITIWHYRNSETFKGIGNYDYYNKEMSLME